MALRRDVHVSSLRDVHCGTLRKVYARVSARERERERGGGRERLSLRTSESPRHPVQSPLVVAYNGSLVPRIVRRLHYSRLNHRDRVATFPNAEVWRDEHSSPRWRNDLDGSLVSWFHFLILPFSLFLSSIFPSVFSLKLPIEIGATCLRKQKRLDAVRCNNMNNTIQKVPLLLFPLFPPLSICLSVSLSRNETNNFVPADVNCLLSPSFLASVSRFSPARAY